MNHLVSSSRVRGSSSAIRVGPFDGNLGSIMRIWLDCSRDAHLQKRPLASAKRHPPAAVRISRSMGTRGCSNSLHDAWFLAAAKKNPGTTSPLVRLAWRDVTRGYHMLQTFMRSGLAAAAVPATAATAGNYSSDEMLVERIAAGDKVAMQVLFTRHRTAIYRWLLRFVGNETVAEDLLSDVFFDVWRQAGRFEGIVSVPRVILRLANGGGRIALAEREQLREDRMAGILSQVPCSQGGRTLIISQNCFSGAQPGRRL